MLPQVAEVIQRAQSLQVTQFFCNATKPSDWQQVLNLGRRYACVRPFVGVHPWSIENLPEAWANELEMLVKANRCGIGEIGLDFIKPTNASLQLEIFETQLVLAAEFARPVSIHCVKAWGALTDTLRNISAVPTFMVHAFNGSLEVGRELVRLGGYVSFNALSFTDNRRPKTKQLLLGLPAERILFETESPFGLNQAVDFLETADQVNQPANLPLIIRQAAVLLGKEIEDFAEIIYDNSRRFIQPLEEIAL